MLLVDSSVWIDQLRGAQTLGTQFVDERDDTEDIALTAFIYQEVLQGAADDRAWTRLRAVLQAYPLLEPAEGLDTYELAADLYRRARKRGLTVRKPADCLIAAIALEHGATLVHNDRDFLALSAVEPQLLLYPARAH